MSYTHNEREVPLASLRAFEAAARLGGFTRAAIELGLTQSAVSRHVRALEDRFGARLFTRHGRSVALTDAGRDYAQSVAEAFRLLRSASARMYRRSTAEQRLTISLLPSVAALWLAPRLSDFTARNPAIELRIHASRQLVDFAVDDVDLGIRYGLGAWPDARSELLARETLTPVCSPEFARRHLSAGNASALRALPLLADDLVDEWRHWFEAAGIDSPASRFGPRFDDSASLYLAAASGAGIALGRSLLVERALRDGQLVAPIAVSAPATYAYWLVTPDRGEPRPAARRFMAWLRQQAAQAP